MKTNKNTVTFRIRNLTNGRIMARGITRLGRACRMANLWGMQGIRCGWEAEE